MKENEKYWLQLYEDGWIEVDFETGDVFSWLTSSKVRKKEKRKIGSFKIKNGEPWYVYLNAGPSRQIRYSILAHRMIWTLAYGEIPYAYEINHKNGIKNDNRLCNLELTTKSENELHKRRILGKKGGASYGENSTCSKLTYDQVLDIRWLWDEGVKNLHDLANEFNVTTANIRSIVNNKTWVSGEKKSRKNVND